MTQQLDNTIDTLDTSIRRAEADFVAIGARGRLSLGPGKQLAFREGRFFIDFIPKGQRSYSTPLLQCSQPDRIEAAKAIPTLWQQNGGSVRESSETET